MRYKLNEWIPISEFKKYQESRRNKNRKFVFWAPRSNTGSSVHRTSTLFLDNYGPRQRSHFMMVEEPNV